MNDNNKFAQWLDKLAAANLETNRTTSGQYTIKQSQRNKLRKEGIHAFAEWLRDDCGLPCEEIRDGIVFHVDSDALDQEICIETKLTFKSLDFNLDDEIEKFEEEKQMKAKAK